MVRGTGRGVEKEGSEADRKAERLSRQNVKLFIADFFLHKVLGKTSDKPKMLCSVFGGFTR